VAIANALQLEAAQATPVHSRFNYTTPCQVWSRWTYPFPYYSDLLLIHYFMLWPWPLTLNIWNVSPVTWWNSVPNLNAIEQSMAEL